MNNSENGSTSLMYDVQSGNISSVKLLIQAGADVNRPDNEEQTPLRCAINIKRHECMKLLIEAGADVNKVDDGTTALMYAAQSGYNDGVKLLIQTGADVNISVSGGNTALNCATEVDDHGCMKLLVEAGADRCGYALICAILKRLKLPKCKERIKALLLAGAIVNIGPVNALTSCQGHREGIAGEMAQLLLAAGEKSNEDEIADVPDVLKPSEQMSLMYLCRELIREHLLEISNTNLLFRVPKLGLRSRIVEYLLYGVSICWT